MGESVVVCLSNHGARGVKKRETGVSLSRAELEMPNIRRTCPRPAR